MRVNYKLFFKCIIGKYTLVMELIDIVVRLIDVTCDPFHLQDIGIQELSVRLESNVVEIVSIFNFRFIDPLEIYDKSHAFAIEGTLLVV